eukprot:SAG11_NODE_6538_length_1292_cov_4.109807_1_plen_149_part_00
MVQKSAGTDSASMETIEEGQSDSEAIEKTPISLEIPNTPLETVSPTSSEMSISEGEATNRMLDFSDAIIASEPESTATIDKLTPLGDDNLIGGIKPNQYALRPRGNDKKVIPRTPSSSRQKERCNFLYAKTKPSRTLMAASAKTMTSE